jgi:hypothetical protein
LFSPPKRPRSNTPNIAQKTQTPKNTHTPNKNKEPLQRGYPPPPLEAHNSSLVETWGWRDVTLRGASWFGFNGEQGMVDGLWNSGADAGATDFAAQAYQLKLLGFNGA